MKRKPKLDIDALIDMQLLGKNDRIKQYVKCPRCEGEWHGLPNAAGCSGSHVETPDESNPSGV